MQVQLSVDALEAGQASGLPVAIFPQNPTQKLDKPQGWAARSYGSG